MYKTALSFYVPQNIPDHSSDHKGTRESRVAPLPPPTKLALLGVLSLKRGLIMTSGTKWQLPVFGERSFSPGHPVLSTLPTQPLFWFHSPAELCIVFFSILT